MKSLIHLFLLGTAIAQAGSRGSVSYTLTIEENGASGGGRSESSSYTLDSSIGGTGGLSSVTSPDLVAKTGYIGQLYDLTEVLVEAQPATIDEGGERQLGATGLLDDETLLTIDAVEVAWSVVSGPLTGISGAGLAAAGNVYEATPATVRGAFSGMEGDLTLTVLNVGLDDFKEYAGDGIDDDWQVLHFGEPPNPLAAPGENADADPDDNEFEFLSGFDPNDPADFFRLSVVDVAAGTASLELNKVIPNRIYTLRAGTDLIDFNETVTRFSVVSELLDHTELDPNAAAARKFYILEVAKP